MRKAGFSSHALLIIILAMSLSFMSGCKEDADDFFTGRPSDMSMLHGRISAGDPEAIVDLLRVPARFPVATESHIGNWQGFIIAWWQYPDKRDHMIKSFGNLSSEEAQALRSWILLKNKYLNQEKALVLDEIYAALNKSGFVAKKKKLTQDEISATAHSPEFITNDPVKAFVYSDYARGSDYFINGNSDTFIFRCILTKDKAKFDGIALSEISIWGNRTGPWEIFKKKENGSFELIGTDIVADTACLESCRTKAYLSSGQCAWDRGWPKEQLQ